MRFRAILVVESDEIDTLIKKMKALGNIHVIDIFDSERKRWLSPDNDFNRLLKEHIGMKLNA